MSQQQSYRPILSIFDLLDRVLDKGLVIDANLSVSLVGIEILVVRARIVVAGVELKQLIDVGRLHCMWQI